MSLENIHHDLLKNMSSPQQYINDNNKKPSNDDNNIEIKQLYSWISNQQTKYKTKSQIMINTSIYKNLYLTH